VTLSITDWCGNMMFTTASFRRTTSYGLVVTEPLARGGVHVRVLVFVRHAPGAFGRSLGYPARLAVRRFFIKRFLSADASLLNGVSYNPHGLIDADRHLAEYFQWLAGVSQGIPHYDAQEVRGNVSGDFQLTAPHAGLCKKG
jgi:hypothetical protein